MKRTTRGSWVASRLREHGVACLRPLLSTELFTAVWPTRYRESTVLIPEVIFWLMAFTAFGDGSFAGCISTFWSTLPLAMPWLELPLEPLNDVAFTKARNLLPVEFFRRLFSIVLERFDKATETRFLWKGHRVWGLDGSELDLPAGYPALVEAYGSPSNKLGAAKHPQALLVGLVDLFAGTCRGFDLARVRPVKREGKEVNKREGEQSVALRLMKEVGPGDLILGDRNFPSYRMLAAIRSQSADLLIRLPKDRFTLPKYTRQALKNPNEWLVILELPAHVRKEFPELGTHLTLRVLRYEIPGFRPSHLITSLLDDKLYPYEELVALYHERWRHETSHREWKHTLELANLRSRSPDGILREVFTQLILNNVLRWLQAESVEAPLRPVDIQFKATKRLVLAALPAMTQAKPAEVLRRYEALKKQIAKKRIRVRPGRSFSRRKNETRGKDKGQGRIVQAARLPDAQIALSMPALLPKTQPSVSMRP